MISNIFCQKKYVIDTDSMRKIHLNSMNVCSSTVILQNIISSLPLQINWGRIPGKAGSRETKVGRMRISVYISLHLFWGFLHVDLLRL